jgi:hypothetical protein
LLLNNAVHNTIQRKNKKKEVIVMPQVQDDILRFNKTKPGVARVPHIVGKGGIVTFGKKTTPEEQTP